MHRALLLIALAFSASALKQSADDVNRPVNKVIALLKEMMAQLEAEQKEDEEIYDKLACWCETNDKAKTKAIEEAEERISQLTADIEQLASQGARLKQEIANLEKEKAQNEASLAQATAIRAKEHDAFAEESKDLTESIASLKAAITVLSKHHAPPAETLLDISTLVRHQLSKHADLLSNVITPSMKRRLHVFLQGDFFGNAPTFKQAYSPRSGEIFGILQNMLDTFNANLKQAQEDEDAAQKAFDELKAAKEAEIAACEDQLDQKKEQLANTGEDLAGAKSDLEDTRAGLAADQKFLMDLKEKCAQTDEEWAERQKTRQEEMKAVSDALAILTADDAHDLFVRTFNPGFAVKNVAVHDQRRARAAKLLRVVAKKVNDPALLQLAAETELDAFTKVQAAIAKMISELQKQQKDEATHRDWCINERNTNDQQTAEKNRDKSDLEALIAELQEKMDTLAKEIAELQAAIKDAQIQIKRAGEDREMENKEFQTTVTDQRATQAVLNKALQVLQAFYNKVEMMQLQAGQAPPPGFEEYKKNAGANGVMSLIQSIMADAARMEKETVQAEQDSQAAYETFVKDTNADIAAKQRAIIDRTEERAKAEADQTQAKDDLAATMSELEQLAAMSAQLHASCDYIVRNFDVRQTARAQEIEALKQASAILAGAKFGGASLLRK